MNNFTERELGILFNLVESVTVSLNYKSDDYYKFDALEEKLKNMIDNYGEKMKTYEVEICWFAKIRGIERLRVQAKNKEEVEEKVEEELEIDFNNYLKLIDNDWEIDSIKEVKSD